MTHPYDSATATIVLGLLLTGALTALLRLLA
jgi:hypothetical protein